MITVLFWWEPTTIALNAQRSPALGKGGYAGGENH